MGKIKSKMLKRSARLLVDKGVDFSQDFDKNKKMLSEGMPSKKIRNQLAGYMVRLKKHEEKNRIKIEE